MNVLIVGGTFGNLPKKSGVIEKLSSFFEQPSVINGGELTDLPSKITEDLAIWMPNIDNEENKNYPTKKNGTVLICSKVMRAGYTHMEAISRIFSLHGNAVIEIEPNSVFIFTLIDALGNTWYKGESIKQLAEKITEFYEFTKKSVRIPTRRDNSWSRSIVFSKEQQELLDDLIKINAELQNKITSQCGKRFFGNISTRCQQLFPSIRLENLMFVSPRNSNKETLESTDMVLCSMKRNSQDNTEVIFFNGDKPSVDSPIQLEVYRTKEKVNYMIHGHATLKTKNYSFWTGITEHYRLCGDYNEAFEILEATKGVSSGILTLRNHGFLIFSENIDQISNMLKEAEFDMKINVTPV